jgi:hypothetical protein
MLEEPDPTATPESLNTRAVIGLVASVVLAVVGLFILPVLEDGFGLAFGPAFGITLVIEFVAFVGVAVSVLRLHRERPV